MTFAYIESFVLLGQDVFPHMQPYRLIPDLQPVIQRVCPVYKVQVSCAVSQGIWHKEGVLLELNKQGNIWGHQEPIPCNFTDSDSQASELEMPKEREKWHSVSKCPPMALSVISRWDSREPLRALCFHTEPQWSYCSRHSESCCHVGLTGTIRFFKVVGLTKLGNFPWSLKKTSLMTSSSPLNCSWGLTASMQAITTEEQYT